MIEIQRALIELGYDVGSTGDDGDYGPATEKAVAAFQKAQGFSQKDIDARVGPQTATALIAAVKKRRAERKEFADAEAAYDAEQAKKKEKSGVGEPKKEKDAEVEADAEAKPEEPKTEKPKRKHPLVAVKDMSEVEVGQAIVDLLKASSDDTVLPHVMLSLFAHQQAPNSAREAKITNKDMRNLLYSLALRVGRSDQGEEVRDIKFLGSDIIKNRKDKDVQNVLNMTMQNMQIERPDLLAMYVPEPNGAGLERLGREAIAIVDRKLGSADSDVAFPGLKFKKKSEA